MCNLQYTISHKSQKSNAYLIFNIFGATVQWESFCAFVYLFQFYLISLISFFVYGFFSTHFKGMMIVLSVIGIGSYHSNTTFAKESHCFESSEPLTMTRVHILFTVISISKSLGNLTLSEYMFSHTLIYFTDDDMVLFDSPRWLVVSAALSHIPCIWSLVAIFCGQYLPIKH